VISIWIVVSTFAFLESLPWKWEERIRNVEKALLTDTKGDLTEKFISEMNCNVQSEYHCWKQIEVFVDSRFCKYAMIIVGLYPIHLTFGILFVIMV
jgi:hypothetical protein